MFLGGGRVGRPPQLFDRMSPGLLLHNAHIFPERRARTSLATRTILGIAFNADFSAVAPADAASIWKRVAWRARIDRVSITTEEGDANTYSKHALWYVW